MKKTNTESKTVEVKVTRAHEYDEMRTFFDAEFNGVMVYGCTFIEGKKGDFVSFPSRKGQGKDGEEKYFNYVFVKLDAATVKDIRQQIEALL